MTYSFLFIFQIVIKYIQGQPFNTTLLGERLFIEAEFPFFMLDTKQYPTNTQGKFHDFFFNETNLYPFLGDSIIIAGELFNKYRLSLNDI